MIHLFFGDDAKNKLVAYEKFVKSIPKDVEIFPVSRNSFDPMQIESLYSGSSLFYKKSFVIFSGVLEYEETRDFVLDKLELMGESANSFLFKDISSFKTLLVLSTIISTSFTI